MEIMVLVGCNNEYWIPAMSRFPNVDAAVVVGTTLYVLHMATGQREVRFHAESLRTDFVHPMLTVDRALLFSNSTDYDLETKKPTKKRTRREETKEKKRKKQDEEEEMIPSSSWILTSIQVVFVVPMGAKFAFPPRPEQDCPNFPPMTYTLHRVDMTNEPAFHKSMQSLPFMDGRDRGGENAPAPARMECSMTQG